MGQLFLGPKQMEDIKELLDSVKPSESAMSQVRSIISTIIVFIYFIHICCQSAQITVKETEHSSLKI